MAFSVLYVKIIVLFSFLTMTFIFGMIPVIFVRYIQKSSDPTSSQDTARSSSNENIDISPEEQRRKKFLKYKRALSFLSCFAAGVFLATCFLELLPNVRHHMIEILFQDSIFTGFPIGEFVMVCGLFIILVIEQIVLTIKERPSSSDYSQIPSEDQPIFNVNTRPMQQALSPEEEREKELTDSCQSQNSFEGISDEPHILSNSLHASNNCGGSFRTKPVDNLSPKKGLRYSEESPPEGHNRRHHHHSPVDHNLQTHSPLRAMLLVCALSLHSVFEGMTVGLLTDKSRVINIFAALTLHKSILSFSLGMSLVQSKISLASSVKSIIGFSLAAPIGVVIGITITDLWTSTNSGFVHGVLQGIASGTFLYIIFFEILPKEFNCELDRILKVFFLILGYGTVTGILFLGDDVKSPFCKPIHSEG